MIRFMYEFEYDNADYEISPVLLNAKVYELAERYAVVALKTYAAKKFENALESGWNSDDFPRTINEIYTYIPATARDLGKHLVAISHQNIAKLSKNKDFQHTLETVTGFAALLVSFFVGKTDTDSQLRTYQCYCGHEWRMHSVPSQYYYCPGCGERMSD